MYHLDPRSHLIRQGRRAPAHSPNFNARRWRASAEALALTNAPKAKLDALAKSTQPAERPGMDVRGSVSALTRARAANALTERQAAEALGLSTMTVKALRAVAKARGLTGYSKARKSALLAMLA